MLLLSFSYKTSGWELVNLDALKLTNLLVGKNASGKTRTIKALQNVTSFLCMKSVIFGDKKFKTKLEFAKEDDGEWRMIYTFEVVK